MKQKFERLVNALAYGGESRLLDVAREKLGCWEDLDEERREELLVALMSLSLSAKGDERSECALCSRPTSSRIAERCDHCAYAAFGIVVADSRPS